MHETLACTFAYRATSWTSAGSGITSGTLTSTAALPALRCMLSTAGVNQCVITGAVTSTTYTNPVAPSTFGCSGFP